MKIAICTIIPELSEHHASKLNDFVLKSTSADKVVFLSPNNQRFPVNSGFFNADIVEGRRVRFLSAVFVLNPVKLLVWILRIRKWLNTSLFTATIITLSKIREAKAICLNFSLVKVFIWNRYCPEFGVMAEVFKKHQIDFKDIEFGLLDGSLVVDRGFLGEASFFKEVKLNRAIQPLSWDQLNVLKGAGQYAQKKPNIPFSMQNSNVKRILILGGSEIDSGVYPNWYKTRKYIYPFHKNSLHLAREIAMLFPTHFVVLKPHPKHNDLALDMEIARNLRVVNGDPSALFEWCDVVVSNYTKLELQAFLYRKPLVNPGPGLLFHSNGVYTVTDKGQLRQTIELALTKGFDPDADKKARTFLSSYKLSQTI